MSGLIIYSVFAWYVARIRCSRRQISSVIRQVSKAVFRERSHPGPSRRRSRLTACGASASSPLRQDGRLHSCPYPHQCGRHVVRRRRVPATRSVHHSSRLCARLPAAGLGHTVHVSRTLVFSPVPVSCSEQFLLTPSRCRSRRWERLSDLKRPWFEASNGAYIYWNAQDRHWWVDEPSGVPKRANPTMNLATTLGRRCCCCLERRRASASRCRAASLRAGRTPLAGGGAYIVASEDALPPKSGWRALQGASLPLPQLSVE